MSGHTPGPWRLYENSASTPEQPCIGIRPDGFDSIDIAYLQGYVGPVPVWNRSPERTFADARLIAEAPALLELARAGREEVRCSLEMLLESHTDATGKIDPDVADDIETQRELLANFDAVIARAEGQP